MLTKFSVKNFKNFKDWLTFDFTNTKNYEFNKECIRGEVIKTALIYGINGCGKSNLGLALFDIIFHLTDMEKVWKIYGDYRNAKAKNAFIEFKYYFNFNGIILEYHYGKTDINTLLYERIIIHDAIVLEYDRRNSNEKFFKTSLVGTENLIKDLSQIKISVVKYIKSNTVLEINDESEVLQAFFEFTDSMLQFKSLDYRIYQGYEVGSVDVIEYIAKNHTEDFNKFLCEAGFDCHLVSRLVRGKDSLFFEFNGSRIDFLTNASTGTTSLTLFYFWLKRLEEHKASLVFIDEFDAFYHYELSEFVVKQLKKLDCQIILTTHNTWLLNNDLMRPDCCFILKDGKIAPLSSLTDKELREAHNIEKMYRAKVFDNERENIICI
ncbi:AAA family ATPase [Treponema phagedenis]|nr:ATP-binding protein [Treponema phagedenis]